MNLTNTSMRFSAESVNRFGQDSREILNLTVGPYLSDSRLSMHGYARIR